MDHPYEDLTGYLDGSLSGDDLAKVKAHLSSCPSCVADIESATVAREALQQLDEIPQPDGLVARAKRQVSGPSSSDEAPGASDTHTSASAGARSRRWASASLAAAAVIAVVFVGGTMIKQQQQTTELSQQIAALPSAEGGLAGEGSQTEALQDLARAERDRYANESSGRYATSSLAPAPPEAVASDAGIPSTSTADEASKQARGILGLEEARGSSAIRCLRASDSGPGELLRVYLGEVEGIPSYFGVYLEGADPKAKPDRIAVWVASQGDCEVLGYAQAYLTYPSPSPAPEGFDWPDP